MLSHRNYCISKISDQAVAKLSSGLSDIVWKFTKRGRQTQVHVQNSLEIDSQLITALGTDINRRPFDSFECNQDFALDLRCSEKLKKFDNLHDAYLPRTAPCAPNMMEGGPDLQEEVLYPNPKSRKTIGNCWRNKELDSKDSMNSGNSQTNSVANFKIGLESYRNQSKVEAYPHCSLYMPRDCVARGTG